MAKYLFTFGVGSPYRQKCVIVESDNELTARKYMFTEYGRKNVAFVYDYEKYSCLIEKYNYKIMENVKL